MNETEASAFLSDQRARYVSRGRGGSKDKAVKARREEETMALLNKFKAKLSTAQPTNAAEEPPVPVVGSNDPTDLDDIDTLLGDDWYGDGWVVDAMLDPNTVRLS